MSTSTNVWQDQMELYTDNGKEWNGWKCCNEHNSILSWYKDDGDCGWWIAASPNWNGDNTTPVAYQNSDGEDIDMGTINNGSFSTFEEYAQAMEPFLNQGVAFSILYPIAE